MKNWKCGHLKRISFTNQMYSLHCTIFLYTLIFLDFISRIKKIKITLPYQIYFGLCNTLAFFKYFILYFQYRFLYIYFSCLFCCRSAPFSYFKNCTRRLIEKIDVCIKPLTQKNVIKFHIDYDLVPAETVTNRTLMRACR